MISKHKFTLFVIITLSFFYALQGYGVQKSDDTEVEYIVVKFSYLGAQNKSVTSLLFSMNDYNDLADKFATHNVLYNNDKTLLIPLYTSLLEQERIISTVKLLKGDPKNTELSVVLLDTKKDTVVEYRLNRKQASLFYTKVVNIIKSNRKIVEALENWGNATGFALH